MLYKNHYLTTNNLFLKCSHTALLGNNAVFLFIINNLHIYCLYIVYILFYIFLFFSIKLCCVFVALIILLYIRITHIAKKYEEKES